MTCEHTHILLASLADTDFPLVLTVDRLDVGGVTGLSPTVRVRRASTTNSYLDFNDGTFKTSGWTTQDASLTEIERGHYQYTLDWTGVSGLAVGDGVVAEYHIPDSGKLGDSHDLIFFRTAPVAFLTDTGFPLVLTIDRNGGVTGLTPTVRVRKGGTTDSYLDFNDGTFKTSGWTTQDASLTEIGRGTYQYNLDVTAVSGLNLGEFIVPEFRVSNPPTYADGHDVILFGNPIAADTSPPIITNIVPTPGSEIEEDTPITFDVTEESGIYHALFVVAYFPDLGDREVVHDGTNFSQRYLRGSAGSVRTPIANGFSYSIRRTEGWPSDGIKNPRVIPQVYAIDAAGNVGIVV